MDEGEEFLWVYLQMNRLHRHQMNLRHRRQIVHSLLDTNQFMHYFLGFADDAR